MKSVDLFIAFSQQAVDEFKARRQAERDGTAYAGPMDDTTYNVMSKMSNLDNRERLFKKPDIAGKTYTLFSMIIDGSLQAAQDAVDHVVATWPAHIVVVGAWWAQHPRNAGLQVGVSYTYDDEGKITGTTGTPVYGLHTEAWRLFTDNFDGYDGNGDPIYTPLTSNADIRWETIPKMFGQADRVV